ncbi:MAG: UDP-N-acetylmuramate dehydrogenase [Minisyncoccia bacterium]
MILKKDINLKNFTTFKIGGPAKYFTIIRNFKDVEGVLNFLEKEKIRFFVLGGGSNILVKDEGFDGIVIKSNLNYLIIFDDYFISGSGKLINDLVNKTSKIGLSSLENFGGLPGTVGGAIRGNAGCFGFEIKDLILEVTAIDLNKKEIKVFKKDECDFDYRNSFFKKNREWLILEGKFIIKDKKDPKELLKIIEEKINYRKNNHPIEYPCAGSIFKNLDFEKASQKLKELALEKNLVKDDPFKIIPAGFIINEAGLTGKQIGDAKISEKHSNFIINLGKAKAKDVLDLIDLIKDEVNKKFDVVLEEEIEIVS